MKNIAGIRLHVVHLQLCHPIDQDLADIVFLTALLCVKVRALEDQAELFSVRDVPCAVQKRLSVVDGLDDSRDISPTFFF